MNKNHGIKKIIIGIVILAIVVVGAYIGVGNHSLGDTNQDDTGAKTVTIQITDDENELTSYEISTDEEYLRDVLDELAEEQEFTFSGDESEYGLYVTIINGTEADYDADGAYWSWYVNDEYCSYGIDSQPVNDGDVFDIKYEVYEEE